MNIEILSVRDSVTDPDVLGLGMFGFRPSSQPLKISLQFKPGVH